MVDIYDFLIEHVVLTDKQIEEYAKLKGAQDANSKLYKRT